MKNTFNILFAFITLFSIHTYAGADTAAATAVSAAVQSAETMTGLACIAVDEPSVVPVLPNGNETYRFVVKVDCDAHMSLWMVTVKGSKLNNQTTIYKADPPVLLE